ncbi:LINE-1 reverse transcriptase-like protein [Elysia marginata]|uniref:LINE-1 reverse transcriptase-like protein n=1 Tax=Elysia marginata TaxID=1093978 RepID=A0AAV4J116_9GAST|nr:LINE-1 reverse transcriptase-like protein [Elysia marginata]
MKSRIALCLLKICVKENKVVLQTLSNKTTLPKLQSSRNRCMRPILSIRWPEIISNTNLWERTQQQPMEVETRRRKWRWIGHTLRKPRQYITRHSLVWNPQGRRTRGRPKMTWRRETEAEMASAEKT